MRTGRGGQSRDYGRLGRAHRSGGPDRHAHMHNLGKDARVISPRPRWQSRDAARRAKLRPLLANRVRDEERVFLPKRSRIHQTLSPHLPSTCQEWRPQRDSNPETPIQRTSHRSGQQPGVSRRPSRGRPTHLRPARPGPTWYHHADRVRCARRQDRATAQSSTAVPEPRRW